jgi:hypothetical protein
MPRAILPLIIIIGVLAAVIVLGMYFYSEGKNNNFYPTPTPTVSPSPTSKPTTISVPTLTPAPNIITSPTPTVTPNLELTVTYSEISRNETMIVINFKIEPNSYVFQLNADSFYLIENDNIVSSNINDVVIIGTQYSTLYFPINSYNGTNYKLSSNSLPSDTTWIRQ